ncbi:MAG: hypothetical protein Q4D41_07705, partial [Prevotellaceae bacterium]|nr:hypothetical protein [Prevotellaceae bacterium]
IIIGLLVYIVKRKHFKDFCDDVFLLSAKFLDSLGNYILSSVVVCLFVPFLIYLILGLIIVGKYV